MTENQSLSPCPFCRGADIFIEPDERGSGGQHVAPYHVGCKACKAEQMAETEDEAIAAWNRRPTPPEAQAGAGMEEVALIEKAAVRVGMTSLLNHGAASCVFSEGCNGVTQKHLIAFAREIALHCAAALAAPKAMAQGWMPIESAPKEGREMFVVKAFDVTYPECGVRRYTSDPYCVWPGDDGGWVRWPHPFPPTHWMGLPSSPSEEKKA